MTEQQIIDFLSENIDYFVPNDLVRTVFRAIGWWLVQILNVVLDFCSLLYDITFGLVDITEWSVLKEFISEYNPLIKAIMVLSMVILGYIYIIGKNKQNDLLVSVLIFMVIITASNELFATFNSFAGMFKDAVVGDEGIVDGYALVNQNLYDLIYIDERIGLAQMNDTRQLPQYPQITEDDMRMIDITEILKDDEDGLTDQAKDILGKKLEYRQEGSKLDDVYNGLLFTDVMNEYYYRYKFNYGTYYLSALAAIIVFFGVSYKNVRIMWELLSSRILATLFSADLSSKKKIVRVLEGIRDGYYALCFTAITLRSYFIVTEYITDQVRDNGIARGIIMLFVAFCAIDGANIMERITGVDAGLSSATGKLIAGMHLMRSASMGFQQMHQMGHLKRQTKAMEGMKKVGGMFDKEHKPESNMKGMNSAASSDKKEGAKMDGADFGTGGKQPDGHSKDTADAMNSSTNENMDVSKNSEMNSSMNNDINNSNMEGSTNGNVNGNMEEMRGNTVSDSNLDSGAQTDDNFKKMDSDISAGDANTQVDDRQGNNPDIKYSGRKDEKGMFERWAEKPQASKQMQNQSSVQSQPKPSPQTQGQSRSMPKANTTNSNRSMMEKGTSKKKMADQKKSGKEKK